MAIAATTLTNGINNSPTTSNNTASVTPTTGSLQLLVVRTFKSGGSVAPSSVTGNGLTWVSVVPSGTFGPSGNNGHYLYRALGTASSGVITIAFASSPGDMSWQLTEFSGVDTGGTNGSGAIVQSAAANSGSGTGATSTVTLAAFGDATNNAAYGTSSENANQTATTNMTNLLFTSATGGNGSLANGWQIGQRTSIQFTFGSASWGATAVEIKAAAAGATGTLATTNAADTSAASGTTTVTGTLARTNANDTSAAAGTTTVTGTLARTNANDTSAAAGTTTVTGTLARTNANDTSTAAGSPIVNGSLARTNADDTLAASGAAGTISGTLARTNANDTLSAAGYPGDTPPAVVTEPTGGGYEVSRATRAQWRKERQEYEDAQAYAELLEREDEELLILL